MLQNFLEKFWKIGVFITMDSSWKKFLHTVLQDDFDKLIASYFVLRKMFQEKGVSNSQLEMGEGMTYDMYAQREEIINMIGHIKKTLVKYGLTNDVDSVVEYILFKLKEVDDQTPLKD